LLAAAALGAPVARAPYADEPSYPRVELTNRVVDVLVFLPDADRGYYRSTRFDWYGMIAQVRFKGHTFFEPWQNSNDPKEMGRPRDYLSTFDGTGTAEEFRIPLGYFEAHPGEPFVKIGVGLLKKADDMPYSFARRHKLLKPVLWQVSHGKDWMTFEQHLDTDFGYSYH
jgi:hypothetical protein